MAKKTAAEQAAEDLARAQQLLAVEAQAALQVMQEQAAAVDKVAQRQQQLHQTEAQAALDVARKQQQAAQQQASELDKVAQRQQQLHQMEARAALDVARKQQEARQKQASELDKAAQRQQQLYQVEAQAALDVARKQQQATPQWQAQQAMVDRQKQVAVDDELYRREQAQGGPLQSERQKAKNREQQAKDQQAETDRLEKQRRTRIEQEDAARSARNYGMAKAGLSGDVAGLGMAAAPGPVGLVLAATEGLQKGFRAAADTMRTFNDHTKTSTEKMHAFAEGLPVVGGVLKSFRSMIEEANGVSDALRRTAIETAKYQARMAVVTPGHIQQFQTASAATVAGLEATALGGIPGRVSGPLARGTVSGQYAYQEARARQPAQDALSIAQAEATAARQAMGHADTRIGTLATKEKLEQRKRDQAWANYEKLMAADDKATKEKGGWRGAAAKALAMGTPLIQYLGGVSARGDRKAGFAKELGTAERRDMDLLGVQAEKMDAINRKKELGLSLTQKEAAVRRAGIDLARTELQIAEQREQKAQGQATQLGMMSRAQFEMGKRALALVAKHGTENVTPETLAAAHGVAGETVEKLAQKAGEQRRGQLRGVVREHLGDVEADKGQFRDTLEGARKRTDDIALQVRQLGLQDTQKTAHDVAEVLKGFADQISNAITNAIKLAQQRFEQQQQKRNREGAP